MLPWFRCAQLAHAPGVDAQLAIGFQHLRPALGCGHAHAGFDQADQVRDAEAHARVLDVVEPGAVRLVDAREDLLDARERQTEAAAQQLAAGRVLHLADREHRRRDGNSGSSEGIDSRNSMSYEQHGDRRGCGQTRVARATCPARCARDRAPASPRGARRERDRLLEALGLRQVARARDSESGRSPRTAARARAARSAGTDSPLARTARGQHRRTQAVHGEGRQLALFGLQHRRSSSASGSGRAIRSMLASSSIADALGRRAAGGVRAARRHRPAADQVGEPCVAARSGALSGDAGANRRDEAALTEVIALGVRDQDPRRDQLVERGEHALRIAVVGQCADNCPASARRPRPGTAPGTARARRTRAVRCAPSSDASSVLGMSVSSIVLGNSQLPAS